MKVGILQMMGCNSINGASLGFARVGVFMELSLIANNVFLWLLKCIFFLKSLGAIALIRIGLM